VYARALFRRSKPDKRFVIFTLGRTGSELLCELLDAHAHIHCDREILHMPVFSPRTLVERSCALSRREAYGFKVKANQLLNKQHIADPGAFLRAMHADGWQILYLERTDRLRHGLSLLRLKETRRGHKRQSSGTGEIQRDRGVVIDIGGLVRDIEFLNRMHAEETKALTGLPCLRLTYEADLCSPQRQQATVDRICDWLGLPRQAVSTDLAKLAPRNLREQIANLDDVICALQERKLLPENWREEDS
jgi:LPS sulfotransferase NodH